MPSLLYLNSENTHSLPSSISKSKIDRDKIRTSISHIGVTSFHRAHQAVYMHELIDKHEELNFGICGIDLLESDRKTYNILKDQDGLYTAIFKNANGIFEYKVIGAIVEYFYGPENPLAAIERLAQPDIKIISLTIAEDGYHANEITGEFNLKHPEVEEDILNKFNPKTVFGYLTQAFKLRKNRGLAGCTILSCDNIKANGDTLRASFFNYVTKSEPSLLPWLKQNTSFPNSMVDRITTVTSPRDIDLLKKKQLIYDQWPVVCETFSSWIIEDNFLLDKPDWEKVGIRFVKNIEPFENRKLRVLNAGHSILGILGTLKGYKYVHEAANDEDFVIFLEGFIDNEVAHNLIGSSKQSIDSYKREVINRFKNTHINDRLSRICKESSSKIPLFILPTTIDQLGRNANIDKSAFILAAWCKYYDGIDDQGNPFEISDSLSIQLVRAATQAHIKPESFLEVESVFGNLNTNKVFVEKFTSYTKKLKTLTIHEGLHQFNNNTL